MKTSALGNKAMATKWQRISPLAVVYFIQKIARGLIEHGPQTLAPLLAVIIAGGDSRWQLVGYVAIGIATLMLLGALLSYLKFKYRITEDTVLVHSGVLKRKRVILGFDRIQNVTLREPLYFRPFDLVVLDIDTTGSSGVEAGLAGVPRKLAEDIRQKILDFKKYHPTEKSISEDITSEKGEEPPLLTQPLSELVKYGITSNRIWVYAALISGFTGQIDISETIFFQNFQNYISSQAGESVSLLALFGVLVFFFIIMSLMLASVLGAIFVNYNTEISHKEDRFHRTRGLFERQETSLPISKIQTIKIRQPWLARYFKRFQLHLNKIGFGNGSNRKAQKTGGHFYIPSVTKEFSISFSKRLYPDFKWEDLPLNPIDKMYIWKTLLWRFIPIPILPSIGITIGIQSAWGLLPMLIPLLALPFIILKHRKYGYATDGQHGLVRTGFVGHQLTVFPFYKAQNISLSQSPSQKRGNVATVIIKMASSKVTIPFMPLEDARKWRDRILFEVESTNKNWL